MAFPPDIPFGLAIRALASRGEILTTKYPENPGNVKPDPSRHGPIAGLPDATTEKKPFARYIPGKDGGGQLFFPRDNTFKSIKNPSEQTFSATQTQFRRAANAASRKISSLGVEKTPFNDFGPLAENWKASVAGAAIEHYLAQQDGPGTDAGIYQARFQSENDTNPSVHIDGTRPDVDFTSERSIQEHLRSMGMPKPEDAAKPQALAMFGPSGPRLTAITFNLQQLALHIGKTLPAEYAQAAETLGAATLQAKMVTAVREHFEKHQDSPAAQLPSVPLRVVERALHKAYDQSRKAAHSAERQLRAAQNIQTPERDALVYRAQMATRYADYLRELKRHVTTQAAPYHYALAALQSAGKFGPNPQVDDGKTSSSRVGVSGGSKISAVVTATAGVDSIGNTTDFIDIDGDRNHIRVNGLKLNFNLKEGFDKILSLYSNQQVWAQYTNGRYIAHADPNSHFHAIFKSYVENPRRSAIGERFMRWMIDRSADPRKTKVRISINTFFSELQRFITGSESLSWNEAVPLFASKAKLSRGRNACELHRRARQIDMVASGSRSHSLPTLAAGVQVAIPLRTAQMTDVFVHLDAAMQAGTQQARVDELKKAADQVDGLITSLDIAPVPGGANRSGTAEPDSAYWGTTRVGASVNAGAGLNTAHYLKALAVFEALSTSSQQETEKPKAPNFTPSLEFKLETDAAFRKGALQRLHINPYQALSSGYLANKTTLLKTMNDVRNMLTQASLGSTHPYLAFVDTFDAFAELRTQHRLEGPVSANAHERDVWLEQMLGQKKLRPGDAAERLTHSYRHAARRMAAFMSIESEALHSTPQSEQSARAINLINDGFWQGRHNIDPAGATREEIDVFLGLTRGMIALACSDIDKNMALVTDAAVGQRADLSLNARSRFDDARGTNAAYAKFIAACFSKGNDLGNEHHARHATVLQPGPSDRDDFNATVNLPSLKIPAVNTAIPSDSTLATALGPVAENVALLGGVNLSYQSTVFSHPAPLPRSGTGETHTASGKLSFLLGGGLPALFHAIRSGQAAAATDPKKPTSGRVANQVLKMFAGNEFPSDFKKVFREEMDRSAAPKGVFHKVFHALTTSQTSGISIRSLRHLGKDQPRLIRDASWWVESKGGLSVMPEFLAYFQPGTTLKAGGDLYGVTRVTLAQRLGNDPFYNSMNFVKTGGLNARLKKDAAGDFDLQHMQEMFSRNIDACRTWMSGATPGSMGAIVDNYEQLLDFVAKGGPKKKVQNNALGALQNDQWRDIIDKAHQWVRRDPKDTTALEQLDKPGALEQLLNDARTAAPFAPEDRRQFKAMSAEERMNYLVQNRPDVLQMVFRLYPALNTVNGFVKNALGYGPATNSLFGRTQHESPATATALPSAAAAIEPDEEDEGQQEWL